MLMFQQSRLPADQIKILKFGTYKNKTWSHVYCSVPQSKGLRIAQSVGTSNAENPTSMMYIDPHPLTIYVKLIYEGNNHPKGAFPLLCFLTDLFKKLRSA